jgi:hypothetical protein
VNAPCGTVQIGGTGNTVNGPNCAPISFRTLSEVQKEGIRKAVAAMPASVMITVGSILGSGDGDTYALLFFPLFEGRHLDNQVAPTIRTGFPATFTDVIVAIGKEDDSAARYRNVLVDTLINLGVAAHRANGSKVAPGHLEVLIGFRPEEVKPQQ